MKIRYCDTTPQERTPCQVGWGSIDNTGLRSCTDDPIEKNCRNVVDTSDPVICPYCGTVLGIYADYLLSAIKGDDV